jgi:hypothetical protein
MRAAVVLRGHLRTWRYSKHSIFNTMDSAFDRTDYYCCLWRSSNSAFAELVSDFEGKNLISLEVLDPTLLPYNLRFDSYAAPSWQSNRCAAKKRELETNQNFNYDIVIETRPDVWMQQAAAVSLPAEYSIYSTKVLDRWLINGQPAELPGMEDHLFLMTSRTHDIWSTRHHFPRYDIPTNHCMLSSRARDMELEIRRIEWLNTDLIRPNSRGHDAVTQGQDPGQVEYLKEIWNHSSYDDKLEWARESGIDPIEYDAPWSLGAGCI